jgi:hypothetical protein
MRLLRIDYSPPLHGWLPIRLHVNDQVVAFEASDVPNNPIQQLIDALHIAANGRESSVWWHLEPDGYFIDFIPKGQTISFQLSFAPSSSRTKSHAVVMFSGSKKQVLLPFWRFIRSFQSHRYAEPHWPSVDYGRLDAIRLAIDQDKASGAVC